MPLNWKHHSDLPKFIRPTSILVAWPDDDGAGAYLAGLYAVNPDGSIEAESDGTPPDEPYFWVTEEELLETMPCVA